MTGRPETEYELWEALGADPLATRTMNALKLGYAGPITRETLRVYRYDLKDLRNLGAHCLARIDRLLKEKR